MSPKAHPPRPLPLPDIIIEQQLGIGDAVHLEPGIRMLLDGHVRHVHLFLRSDAVGIYDDYPGVTAYNQSAGDIKVRLLQRPNTAHVVIDSTSHRTMGNKTRMEAYASILCSAVGMFVADAKYNFVADAKYNNGVPALPPPVLSVTPHDRQWAEMYTKKRSDQLMVLWQVMASGGWKSVPAQKSLAVISRLLEEGVAVIVLSRGEVLLPRHPNLRWARGLDIRQLKAVCAVVDRVVAHDSAPAWVASAVGTETVAIFGPTDPDRYARGTPVKVLQIDPRRYCQPCESGCDGTYCLQGIPESVLYEAAKDGTVPLGGAFQRSRLRREQVAFWADVEPRRVVRQKRVKSAHIRIMAVLGGFQPRGGEICTLNLLEMLEAGIYDVSTYALISPQADLEYETILLPEFQDIGPAAWSYNDAGGRADLAAAIKECVPDVLLYTFLRCVPESVAHMPDADRPVTVQIIYGEHSNNTDPYIPGVTDAAVAVSGSTRNFAYKRGIPAEALYMIPPGVPHVAGIDSRTLYGIPDFAAAAKSNFVADAKSNTDTANPAALVATAWVWCFVGGMTSLKRPDLLLESVARRSVQDEYILLAGPVDKGYGTEELAAERQVADRCLFLGTKDAAEIASVYESSDALVVCSWSEAMPLVILEAMSHGLIVVANDVGGIPEVLATPLGQQFGILMNADDPFDFDRALTAARRLDRRACYVAAKRLWRGQYTAASMAAGYDALFKRHLTGW